MSALESAELERLSNLFALGSLENAQEIVELLSIELDGPPLSPNSESLQLNDEWPVRRPTPKTQRKAIGGNVGSVPVTRSSDSQAERMRTSGCR